MDIADWNPRYVAYCVAQGRDPDQQLAHDDGAWPGGRMCGFVLWLGTRWTGWRAATKTKHGEPLQRHQIDAFDRWLTFGAPTYQDA